MNKYQTALFATSAALALTTLPARADDRAVAQQLFQQGRDLMATGKIAEACPKFAAAADLTSTAGVRLNLSDCYEQLGRTASAWAKAQDALTAAERMGDAAAAQAARERVAALEPKLSYLLVTVEKEAAVAGLEVFRDGEKVPAAAWGAPMPVDPGEHEVSATAPGRKRWSEKKAVTGAAAKVSFAVPALQEDPRAAASITPAPAPAGAPAPDGSSPPDEAPSSWSTQRTFALVAGGVGVAGAVVGAVFGLQAMSKKDEADAACPSVRCSDAAAVQTSQDALTAGTISTIGFVVAGVGLAGGTVLWLTAPKTTTQVGLGPGLVQMRGTW
jgi:hypothetical protein